MARNYTIAEAAQIFANGTDMEAIQDINRRMPVLGYKLAILIGNSDPETVIDFFAGFPAYVTANKLNKAFKEGVPEAEETEAEDDAEETEVPEEKPAKKAKKAPAKKEAEEDEDESDGDDPYAGQTAAALFKECKKRGIKVAPKKDAEFYAEKLRADDAKDDDAEDEEEEKPAKKPAKKAAKKAEEDDDDDDWDI